MGKFKDKKTCIFSKLKDHLAKLESKWSGERSGKKGRGDHEELRKLYFEFRFYINGFFKLQ